MRALVHESACPGPVPRRKPLYACALFRMFTCDRTLWNKPSPPELGHGLGVENLQRSWAEICCFGCSCIQHFWPRIVMRKWLNIRETDTDFSADTDEGESDFDSENEEISGWERDSRFGDKKSDEVRLDSRVLSETLPRMRRQKSETIRAQYIKTKDIRHVDSSHMFCLNTLVLSLSQVEWLLKTGYNAYLLGCSSVIFINLHIFGVSRICVGTWNVGGRVPPEDLEIDDWLDVDEPADMYVIGLQEMVPLNAGNIFGAEDDRPVPKWEYIIRDTLNRVRPSKTKFKCYSDPPSPSKFRPLDDMPDIEEDILHDTDSDADGDVELVNETDSDVVGEVHPSDDDNNDFNEVKNDPDISDRKSILNETAKVSENAVTVSLKSQERLASLPRRTCSFNTKNADLLVVVQQKQKLTKTLSGSQRTGWNWPELPLDLLKQHALERRSSFKTLQETKSFRTYNSFKSVTNGDNKGWDLALLTDIDLESIIRRKRRSPFVRMVSKQMVGIFLSIWVRRSLRKHIQNVRVSTVGVGAMGYIGNKGSISVSMSVYQTRFCFTCTHLTSGEKTGDELRRNADVKEIHRRTRFYSDSDIGFPKTIRDHERIIWFGDLNYRINLSYEETLELILRKEWSKLEQKDQLLRELGEGHVFDGWREGTLDFPPTYKYEFNSQKYYGEDPKAGRRNPAWCDRILSFGRGLKLLNYKRNEQMLSDHRPVTAVYTAEVEFLCHRRLQRALSFTGAELEGAVSVQNV
ncbi:hypothetical protein Syun_013732 [Stephania yunnanensis]|uniref:Inositol polyphosphate-related phosphatase domain-containing protein n=1 Tax=Stephania yunnanensis TaxID=152371 RepID=A0AAP0JK73_9MAGN